MNEKEQIITEIQLDKNDVVSLIFYAFTKRITFKILLVLIPLTLILTIYNYMNNAESIPTTTSMFIVLIFVFIMLMPIVLYFSATREFNSNGRLKEKQVFTFDKENIHIKGESFESQLTWDKIYKLTETKKYFYVWQSKNSANIIPKRYLSSNDIEFLKNIKR